MSSRLRKRPQGSRDELRRFWNRLPLPEHHAVAITVGLLAQHAMPLRLPRRLRAMGWLLVTAGIVANAIAVHERGGGDLEQPESLTTERLHGLTRNPIYVGWSGIHLGGALLLSNGWILATWPITLALTHWWVVQVEEHQLADQFGHEYSIYQKRVPRYLGRTWLTWPQIRTAEKTRAS
jgi:protein-S-isoprenylcysteine O-methyltransferase Ste14